MIWVYVWVPLVKALLAIDTSLSAVLAPVTLVSETSWLLYVQLPLPRKRATTSY